MRNRSLIALTAAASLSIAGYSKEENPLIINTGLWEGYTTILKPPNNPQNQTEGLIINRYGLSLNGTDNQQTEGIQHEPEVQKGYMTYKPEVNVADTKITAPVEEPTHRTLTVEATAYVSYCDTGCIGITKTGTNVQNTIYHPTGKRIVAVDPQVIPLGSTVEINGEEYIADDIGSHIKGNRIDILIAVSDTSKAFEYGRRTIEIKVYN